MKIVYIHCRLGNQLFQYAFFRYLIKKGDKQVYLDTTAPFIKKYGGFEIPRIFPNSNAKKHILPYWIARMFYLIGDIWKKVFKINLQTDVEHPSGKKIWWKGYWQEFKYPEWVADELRKELTFLPIDGPENIGVLKQINAANAVSLHVRRGDYVHPEIRVSFGDICTLAYYQEAIEYIRQQVNAPSFFVFSDDPQWVKENLSIPNAVYINWNTGKNNFRDMQLMSECKHHIIANSSFSWWGAWLNPSRDKVVACPAKWFHNYPEDFATKLLPPSWHRIGQAVPNVSLIVDAITGQEVDAILRQSYGDFELLIGNTCTNADKRIKTLSQKPLGNHVFQLSAKELSLFKEKNYLRKKLITYFKSLS